jgi:hypothetical protein
VLSSAYSFNLTSSQFSYWQLNFFHFRKPLRCGVHLRLLGAPQAVTLRAPQAQLTEKLRSCCRKSCNLPPCYARFVRQSLPFLSISAIFRNRQLNFFHFSHFSPKCWE